MGNNSSKNNKQALKKESTPLTKGEVEAPGFKWVTKGEKGSGVEPGIQIDSKSE